jgi:hypothetical protein
MRINNLLKFTTAAFAVLVIAILPVRSYSQHSKVELTPFGGYMLGGSIEFYEGKFKIEDNASFGGILGVRLRESQLVEISYTYMDTEGEWRPYGGYNIDYPDTTFDLTMNYIQIGSTNEIILDNDAIRPYGMYSLGASWLHPKGGTAEDEWFFAVNLGVGLKYYISERVGIRLQARMLVPFVWGDTGVYFGFGSGGVTVGTWSAIIQGDFTGGLIIALGD